MGSYSLNRSILIASLNVNLFSRCLEAISTGILVIALVTLLERKVALVPLGFALLLLLLSLL